MLIISGRDAGFEVTARQWANDWISVDGVSPSRSILSPMQVRLTPGEVEKFRASQGSPNLGQFWKWWYLTDDGLFTDLRAAQNGIDRATRRRPR